MKDVWNGEEISEFIASHPVDLSGDYHPLTQGDGEDGSVWRWVRLQWLDHPPAGPGESTSPTELILNFVKDAYLSSDDKYTSIYMRNGFIEIRFYTSVCNDA